MCAHVRRATYGLGLALLIVAAACLGFRYGYQQARNNMQHWSHVVRGSDRASLQDVQLAAVLHDSTPMPGPASATTAVSGVLEAADTLVARITSKMATSKPAPTAEGAGIARLAQINTGSTATAPAVPPERCPKFSAESVANIQKNNTIIFTIVNRGMLSMARNWLEWLNHVGATNVMIASFEADVDSIILGWNVSCVDISDLVDIDDEELGQSAGFRSPLWFKIIWMKVEVFPELLRLGYNAIWSDADVVWFQDPTAVMLEHPEVDVIMSTDCLSSKLKDSETYFENAQYALKEEYNSGTTFFRHSRAATDLAYAWKVERDAERQARNQGALNWELLRPGLHRGENETAVRARLVPGTLNLLRVFRDRLTIGILPNSRVLSGRTLSFQHLDRIMGVKPVAFHTTMALGHWSKVARIQEAGLWHGNPATSEYGHNNTQENFVAMDIVMPQVPYDVAGVPFGKWVGQQESMEAYHMLAVEFQLSQIAAATHIAHALNRTLIFPKLACFCDFSPWEDVIECRAAGATEGNKADFPLPYSCPVDTVVSMPNLNLNATEAMPVIRHRANGFLESALVAKEIRESQVRIRPDTKVLCPDGDCAAFQPSSCGVGRLVAAAGRSSGKSATPSHHEVAKLETKCVPEGLTDQQLSAALSSMSSVRVLHLGNAPVIWGGWEDPMVQAAVDLRLAFAVTPWRHRSTEAAERIGRNTSEPYVWKNFGNARKTMLDAYDGAISVLPELESRAGPAWPSEALQQLGRIVWHGTFPEPSLWAINDLPQNLWPA